MAKVIQWKHGNTAQSEVFTGALREITVDDDLHTLRLHDGKTQGGILLARVSGMPTKLSQLIDDMDVWHKDELTKLSQLDNDQGYWEVGTLTKVSQLANDSGFKTGHCSYCTHCTYCQQCSNCHNCTTINCTTVNCTTIKCNLVNCKKCSDCGNCDCLCQDCGDDGNCFAKGEILTTRGLIDVFDIRVGDEIIDANNKAHEVVGVKHNRVAKQGCMVFPDLILTEHHPFEDDDGDWIVPTEGYEKVLDPVIGDNGVAGVYSQEYPIKAKPWPLAYLAPDTPTVNPICEETVVVVMGGIRTLIPGRRS